MLPNARRDCANIGCFWMGVLVYSHILSLYTPNTKNDVQVIIEKRISSDKNNVFAFGASGNVGSDVIHDLVRKGVETTAYVRNEKARELFKDELATGLLSSIVGTYISIGIYARTIEGHDRLFILVSGSVNKPVSMSKIKEIFGKIAYEQRVRQIVDVSSYNVRIDGIQGIIGHMNTESEDKLLALAEKSSDERSLVILSPGAFMSNHFMNVVVYVNHLYQQKHESIQLVRATIKEFLPIQIFYIKNEKNKN
ncbi:unnamed protein product [Rotaria magnacalcarata]|uniref:NAD(P)-binding domain-containing protein n=1 Tax=Rotaria magnacalcarata TaxID=392030 RepID=A0A816UAD9_9BILA|nr:unnamed protein product [Rotaria magnacalcarata]